MPILFLLGCGAAPDRTSVPAGEAWDRLAEARVLQCRGQNADAFLAALSAARTLPVSVEAADLAITLAATDDERAAALSHVRARIAATDPATRLPWLVEEARLDPDLVSRERRLDELLAGGGVLSGWVHAGLAEVFAKRGNQTAALEAWRAATEATPSNARAWFGLAGALMELRRPLDAAPAYETYLGSWPRDPAALYNLGWILLKERDRPRDARPYLERAAAACPDDAAILLGLGTCALSETPSDVPAAEAAFRRAAEIAPRDADVHLNLAVLLADHLDRPAEAARHLRTFLELGGTGRERVEVWISELEAKGR